MKKLFIFAFLFASVQAAETPYSFVNIGNDGSDGNPVSTGWLRLHGDPTNENDGGRIELKLADDYDTEFDAWFIHPQYKDLYFSPSVQQEVLLLEGQTKDVSIVRGNLKMKAKDIIFSNNEFTISADTVDGYDTKDLSLGGGGANNILRGGGIKLHGNEKSTEPGIVKIYAGDVIGGTINFYTGYAKLAGWFDRAQNFIVEQGNLILKLSAPPATSTASCSKGTIQYDSNYIYICIATDTWKRSTLSNF